MHSPSALRPVPMTDAASITRTIATGWAPAGHEAFLGARPADGFVLGGISAGATLAAVTTGLAIHGKDNAFKLSQPPTGVFLCAPWLFTEGTLPKEYKSEWTAMLVNDGEGLTPGDVKAIQTSLHISELHSPLLTPAAYFRYGKVPNVPWPRSYIQACQYDPLRDDAIIFTQMLEKIGTDVKLRVFPDDGHAGMTAVLIPHKSTNPTIAEDTIDGMAWLLRWERVNASEPTSHHLFRPM